jgi:phosphopantothenoylcysteine decarboxylase
MSRIVLGVCGGIAAFKSAALASQLVQAGHSVRAVMTPSATAFLGPATLTAICGEAPATQVFDPRYPTGAHIELAEGADLLVIAPATARCLASCAYGLADDLLATLYLQVTCPVLMAPAMSTPMWDKPAVQRNLQQLTQDGVQMVGPGEGWLSCRRVGIGRMAEPTEIMDAIRALF